MAYHIVAVDDHFEITELLAIVLRHPEIVLHLAYDGEEGLALIRKVQPDLILLDVMMPRLDGWEVYDLLRADPQFSETPIIMLTVVPEEAERKRQLAGSAIDFYVTKPFDTVHLRRRIERLLGGVSLWDSPGAGAGQ